MTLTEQIHESVELSLELKKLLAKAGIKEFTDLAGMTRLGLRARVPKLKVRHLANLEEQLEIRELEFQIDDSIRLDEFICQRDLFNLWKIGIDTYPELDQLPFAEFVEVMGGPQSIFMRQKKQAKWWMERRGLNSKKYFELPGLTKETAELLYKGGLKKLQDIAKKTDFDLAKVLQPNFGRTKARLSPLTRARLREIKYALWKAGIERPFRPL